MNIRWLIVGCIVCVVGCGSPMESDPNSEWELTENSETSNDDDNNVSDDDDNNVSDDDDNTSLNNNDDTSLNDDDHCLPTVPLNHRPAATQCDDERAPGSEPFSGGPVVDCETDDDCVDGDNGRCTGNGHDGWRCTYDSCFSDDGCGAGSVCECEGGFRSDHNVCLAGNCQTDDDCATGYCSPSWGTCGNYTGTIGYFCRTCEDECVNDSDCGGTGDQWGDPYCMYDEGVGHWRCADSHCVG